MATLTDTQEEGLVRFGFSFGRGGTHLARSMMLEDLRKLIHHLPKESATRNELACAIIDENCLGKRSVRTRALTVRHLRNLYALNPAVTIYRAMRYFWKRDTEGEPLIAFLVAYSRDSVLRSSAPFVLPLPIGTPVVRRDLDAYLEESEVGRFSSETLKATSQRILASWTLAGHLAGRARKTRVTASATAGSVAMALFMGYVTGARGLNLFETEYAKLLDCSVDRAIELAESASRKGWIVYKRIGSVVEVLFPNLLTTQELEWVREQS